MKKQTKTPCSGRGTRFSFLNLTAALSSAACALFSPVLADAAGITLKQTIGAEVRYDDNVTIASDNQKRESDVVFLLMPSFEASRSSGGLELNAAYRPTGSYYLKTPEINTISHMGSISMRSKLSPNDSLSIEERLIYSKESLETTLIGVQNRRNSILSNSVSVGFDHSFSPKTSAGLSASDSTLNFDDPIGVDSRSDTASLSVSHHITPETQLTGNYGFSHTKFHVPNGSGQPELNTHSASVGFVMNSRNNLSFTARSGVVYSPAPNNFYDWIANAELRKTFQKTSVNFGYLRATTSSSGLTDQLTITDTFNAEYAYRLTRTINVRAFGAHARNHSKPVDTLDVKSINVGVSGEWDVYRWLSFGLGYSHFKQWSSGTLGTDITRDHIYANVNITTYEGRF